MGWTYNTLAWQAVPSLKEFPRIQHRFPWMEHIHQRKLYASTGMHGKQDLTESAASASSCIDMASSGCMGLSRKTSPPNTKMDDFSCFTWQVDWFSCSVEALRVQAHILNVSKSRGNYSTKVSQTDMWRCCEQGKLVPEPTQLGWVLHASSVGHNPYPTIQFFLLINPIPGSTC